MKMEVVWMKGMGRKIIKALLFVGGTLLYAAFIARLMRWILNEASGGDVALLFGFLCALVVVIYTTKVEFEKYKLELEEKRKGGIADESNQG